MTQLDTPTQLLAHPQKLCHFVAKFLLRQIIQAGKV